MNNKRNHIQFFSKQNLLFMVPLFFVFFSASSYAGLAGVKKIIITSSSLNTSQWLQVSEVVAIESNSGKDIALITKGATTGSTSFYSKQAHAGNVISGVGPDKYPKIYHSGGKDKSPTLEITLASSSQLDSITIYGRADCCFKRDYYDLTLLNSENKIIFQKLGLDASNKLHSARVNLTSNKPKKKSPITLSANSKAEKSLLTSKNTTKSKPISKAKTRKPANARPKNFYRDIYNQAVKKKEVKKFESALKLLNQIIAENNDDYWVAAAKNQKENMYVVTSKAINQIKSGDLQIIKTVNSKPDSYYKNLYGRARQLEKGKRFDEAFEVLNQIINDNSSVKWVKHAKGQKKNVEISRVKHEQYLERRRLDEIKYQKSDEIRRKAKKAKLAKKRAQRNEERRANEEIRANEEKQAAELKHQVIRENTERYPLKNLKFSSNSVIDFYKLKIGKTKKDDAIKIYDELLRGNYAKEIVENDMAFILRQALRDPRIIRSSLLVEQSSFQIHDNITLQCFKYFGKYSNKIVNDCLYFYKDILVGGRFNRGYKTPESIVNLVPSFPVKEDYVSNNVVKSLKRSNDQFVFKSLTGGFITTTKTTRTTALTPLGVTGYKSSNNTIGLICISPKEINEMLSKFSERYSNSCH